CQHSDGPPGPSNADAQLPALGQGPGLPEGRSEGDPNQRSTSRRYWSNCCGVMMIRVPIRECDSKPSSHSRYTVELLTPSSEAACSTDNGPSSRAWLRAFLFVT